MRFEHGAATRSTIAFTAGCSSTIRENLSPKRQSPKSRLPNPNPSLNRDLRRIVAHVWAPEWRLLDRLEADEDVYIAGRVEGMLMSIGHQITICRGACVSGNIRAARLVVEDGAVVKASFDPLI